MTRIESILLVIIFGIAEKVFWLFVVLIFSSVATERQGAVGFIITSWERISGKFEYKRGKSDFPVACFNNYKRLGNHLSLV